MACLEAVQLNASSFSMLRAGCGHYVGLSPIARKVQSREGNQEPRLDVLALEQAAHGPVQGFARALCVAPARRVAVRAQPHLCAAGKLPARGLDHLLRQLILQIQAKISLKDAGLWYLADLSATIACAAPTKFWHMTFITCCASSSCTCRLKSASEMQRSVTKNSEHCPCPLHDRTRERSLVRCPQTCNTWP